MSVYEKQVGEWITIRQDEMGLSVRALAALLGVDEKTVGNAEAGRTAVQLGTRARWEDVLGWERGSLTVAYKRGERPSKVTTASSTDSLEAFVRANVPPARQEAAITMLRALIEEDRPTRGDEQTG